MNKKKTRKLLTKLRKGPILKNVGSRDGKNIEKQLAASESFML